MSQERFILGMKVTPLNYDKAVNLCMSWTQKRESRAVAIATVNNVMEGFDDPAFRDVMNAADIVTSDGMPLVWILRLRGEATAERVYGPDLTPLLLSAAEENSIPVGFYGTTPETLSLLKDVISKRWPKLDVVYWFAPPFRPLSVSEDEEVIRDLNESGARLVFVGIGAPKQERWIIEHRGKVNAVMLGVGAAFDFLAGSKLQAPRWMMKIGMEWFFRLITEPKRLWKRYLKHNPRFIVLVTLEQFGWRIV